MASDNKTPPRDKRNSGGGNQDPKNQGGNFLARSWFWLVLAVLILFGSRFFFGRPTDTANMIGLNQVAQHITEGDVERISVQGDIVVLELKNGDELRSRKDVDELQVFLTNLGATIVDPAGEYYDDYYAVFFLDPDGLKLEGMKWGEKTEQAKRKRAAAKKAKAKPRPGRKGG